MTFCIASVVSCSGVGFTSEGSNTPLTAASTTQTVSSAEHPPSTPLDATTTAPTTTTTINAATSATPAPSQAIVEGPFPTQYEYGRCNPESIRQDFGTAPQGPLGCAGAWAVTRINACPAETECEGIDIFRWTDNGWVHRGFFNSSCVLDVDMSGLPRQINDQFLPGNQGCRELIAYQTESSTGPLKFGDKGERVRRLQDRLIQWKLLDDLADTRFGANTKNAVTDFQYLAGLQPTGVLDPRTASALGLPWP